ncbi:plastidic glucose transporter 4 [Tanacetum coccineum]
MFNIFSGFYIPQPVQLAGKLGIISQEFLEASIPPHLMAGTAQSNIVNITILLSCFSLCPSLGRSWHNFLNKLLSSGSSCGPIHALLLSEIFASRTRAKAVALSLCMHWITNFFIGLCFLSVVTQFGMSKVYLRFATICILVVMYIASKVVETKGRLMEDIERELSTPI